MQELFYIHNELDLHHDEFDCATILLNHTNKSVKIDE